MHILNSILLRIIGFFLIIVLLYSCGEKKQQTQAPPEIPVVKVLQKDVPIYRQFVGQVYGQSDIPIRARVAGFLEGIHFNEGLDVSKGQLLYSVDPSEYQEKVATAESHLAEAQTALAKAKSDLDRIEPLAEINAVSKSDLDAVRANYDAASAYVDAMEANVRFAKINLGYCWIKSPINGVIGKTQAKIGEFVGKEPNPVILNTVSTVDTIRVEFYIAEADYIRLARFSRTVREFDREETKERVKQDPNLSLILADESIFDYKGYVNFINREVDPQTGSLLIQTTFPNPENLLKPGQYAKVVVKMTDIKGGILIPQRCIMELQGQYSVYVVNAENKVESRQIEISDIIGDMALIKNGLSASEMIVIDALQKVRTDMVVAPEVIEFESQSTNQF
jgi:membrane fusion protein (multidrug efflux system)